MHFFGMGIDRQVQKINFWIHKIIFSSTWNTIIYNISKKVKISLEISWERAILTIGTGIVDQ